MSLAVMDTAERNNEFVTDLPAERTRLHEAEVVRIGMLAPTDQTRPFGHEPQMLRIAMATRFGDHEGALVNPDGSGIFRRNWRGRGCGSHLGRSWFADPRDLGVVGREFR